ncbi:MAG: hypothetical protein KGJ13_00250 [Patescibacteria group bacterium]|nr:hypothetical protein [Patescibacteria group bacterium]
MKDEFMRSIGSVVCGGLALVGTALLVSGLARIADGSAAPNIQAYALDVSVRFGWGLCLASIGVAGLKEIRRERHLVAVVSRGIRTAVRKKII